MPHARGDSSRDRPAAQGRREPALLPDGGLGGDDGRPRARADALAGSRRARMGHSVGSRRVFRAVREPGVLRPELPRRGPSLARLDGRRRARRVARSQLPVRSEPELRAHHRRPAARVSGRNDLPHGGRFLRAYAPRPAELASHSAVSPGRGAHGLASGRPPARGRRRGQHDVLCVRRRVPHGPRDAGGRPVSLSDQRRVPRSGRRDGVRADVRRRSHFGALRGAPGRRRRAAGERTADGSRRRGCRRRVLALRRRCGSDLDE